MITDKEILKINVLVVDDHPIYRDGICNMLKNIDIVGRCEEAENGLKALEALENLIYEIIFLDIDMPEMDGIIVSRIIKNRFPESKIIVLTMSNSSSQIVELLENGVKGYVLKNTNATELKRTIRLILEGNIYLTPEIKEIWSKYILKKAAFEIHNDDKVELTKRQEQIVFLLCKQMTIAEIANNLFISEVTVINHRAQIMKKLNIKGGIGIALYAVKSGIFPIDFTEIL